jgi:hypothetical protein
MRLKEFIDRMEPYCGDDLLLITSWAILVNKEPELINQITALVQSMVSKDKEYKNMSAEWAGYAFDYLVPAITADTDFTTCINAVRLAYLAGGSPIVSRINKILVSDNITLEKIKELHPTIYEAYLEFTEE